MRSTWMYSFRNKHRSESLFRFHGPTSTCAKVCHFCSSLSRLQYLRVVKTDGVLESNVAYDICAPSVEYLSHTRYECIIGEVLQDI
jgi:hypothetical protein